MGAADSSCSMRGVRKGRAKNPSSVPSYFFLYLRRVVPARASITTSRTRPLDANRPQPKLEMDLVQARIGEHTFEFVMPKQEVGHFGRLSLNRIDGKGIDEIVSAWASDTESIATP